MLPLPSSTQDARAGGFAGQGGGQRGGAAAEVEALAQVEPAGVAVAGAIIGGGGGGGRAEPAEDAGVYLIGDGCCVSVFYFYFYFINMFP